MKELRVRVSDEVYSALKSLADRAGMKVEELAATLLSLAAPKARLLELGEAISRLEKAVEEIFKAAGGRSGR